MNHLIILPVLLPAVLGAGLVLARRAGLGVQRLAGLAGTLMLLALAVGLLVQATTTPAQAYFLGGWPAPFGIVLVLDRLAALMLVLTAALAVLVQIHAVATGWDARGTHFHALYLFQLMGLNGAFLTGDAFNLFVFFEVLLIASYGLMIHSGGAVRLRAGVQYVAFNLVASVLFLFALATLYGVTGTLNLADLAGKVAQLPPGDAALIRVAGVLLLAVFGIKAALVPLHFWLPATYANAPGPVAALFAVMTKVGAYAVLRVFTLVFPPTTPDTGALFAGLLLALALATLAVGAIGVLGAATLARLVAFAVIAGVGTLFIGLADFTPQGTAAALYYLIHSTLAGAALFLLADLVAARRAGDGLRTALPPIAQHGLIAALFLVAALAMVGMPPFSGFLGKLMILDASRGALMGLIWPIVLTSSLVMIVGYARAGSLLFWKAHELGPRAPATSHPAQPLAFGAVIALIAALAALTVFAAPVMRYLDATAAQLHRPTAYIAANALPGVAP